jgi:hypothetical protein
MESGAFKESWPTSIDRKGKQLKAATKNIASDVFSDTTILEVLWYNFRKKTGCMSQTGSCGYWTIESDPL